MGSAEGASQKELARARAAKMIDTLMHGDQRVKGEFEINSMAGLCNVLSDGPGHVSCELPVQRRHANWIGNLHGGCTGVALTISGE